MLPNNLPESNTSSEEQAYAEGILSFWQNQSPAALAARARALAAERDGYKAKLPGPPYLPSPSPVTPEQNVILAKYELSLRGIVDTEED